MPRRREVPKRPILPDPKYGETLVTKFMNNVMKDGKKSTAESIVYGAFDVIQDRTREDPIKVFKRALENVQPVVEVVMVVEVVIIVAPNTVLRGAQLQCRSPSHRIFAA